MKLICDMSMSFKSTRLHWVHPGGRVLYGCIFMRGRGLHLQVTVPWNKINNTAVLKHCIYFGFNVEYDSESAGNHHIFHWCLTCTSLNHGLLIYNVGFFLSYIFGLFKCKHVISELFSLIIASCRVWWMSFPKLVWVTQLIFPRQLFSLGDGIMI